jgi:hypothetical protein
MVKEGVCESWVGWLRNGGMVKDGVEGLDGWRRDCDSKLK